MNSRLVQVYSMPIYSYRCESCDYRFEQRQRMSDRPLTECPVCEGRVRRVVNSVGIVFKGSGFYVTDNRNGSGPNDTKKSPEHTKGSSSEAKGSPKSEDTGNSEKGVKGEAKKKKATDPAA